MVKVILRDPEWFDEGCNCLRTDPQQFVIYQVKQDIKKRLTIISEGNPDKSALEKKLSEVRLPINDEFRGPPYLKGNMLYIKSKTNGEIYLGKVVD